MDEALLTAVFEAYYRARRHKRSTKSALAFELNLESNLIALYRELADRTYRPGRSVAFIVDEPVKREIFAAGFRDRIVHHLLFGYLNPICERLFIPDSYSCRLGKGTSYGIKRIDHFIRSCSRNYSRDCFILKVDIEGYFMSIDKSILYEQVRTFVARDLARSRRRLYPESVVGQL